MVPMVPAAVPLDHGGCCRPRVSIGPAACRRACRPLPALIPGLGGEDAGRRVPMMPAS
jgi:hypothetical protein